MAFNCKVGDTRPEETIRPLALLPMRGFEEMGKRVNDYLLRWTTDPESDTTITFPGFDKTNFLIEADCPRFGTGEAKGMIHSSVRGYDLYILCDVTNYHVTYPMYNLHSPMSPDDHFADLKRLIAAAGNKPHRITVIMPYLYEGRQHRKNGRESLDCAIALQELYHLGVHNIITFDAHDPRVANAAPVENFDTVQPIYQILKALLKARPDMKIDPQHALVVSPDEGAAPRNIYFSSMLGLDMGLFYKRRDYSVLVNGRNPIIAHEYLGDSVEGKDVIIADDILSSGDSMLDIAEELHKRKAGRVFLAATFALFTEGLHAFDEAYAQGKFDLLLGTNLTNLNPELKTRPWFKEVDVAKYIALIVATLNHDTSISHLLNPDDRIKRLLEAHARRQQLDGQLSVE
ncbi:ribose-phosphate pyrophosphokinase [Ruminococcaceae bacterium OttesenSCG-928-A11]|nr:ribose-phosphate pyrophosphokinase [Ruminococcaceae bacterium OttesenSCG-928-A11]